MRARVLPWSRSKSASSDVKALIEQSTTEVKGGSKLVTEAATKLASMLEGIRDNTNALQAIATESREQASAIEEVNVAVRLMDEMTQHNAALVEETNAAIEQTEAQAQKLDAIVDIFRMDETPVAKAGPVVAPRVPAQPNFLPTQKPMLQRAPVSVPEKKPLPRVAPRPTAPVTIDEQGGIRGMQEKLKSVASTYLKRGNTAAKADDDWSEF
jgi:methyl-accepting chemotaxis protein